MPPNFVESCENASLLLAKIVETSNDAIVSKDLTGTITSWSPAAERIFGYSASEVVGGPISVIIPPERGEEETEILRRIGRGERIEHLETVRMRKDGSRIEVTVTISPLVKDGRIIGALKIARNISEQKQMLQKVETQRARLEVTLASIGDAVIVTDALGAVQFMNPVAESLTGWKATEARGLALETCFNIVNETTRRRVENPVLRVLRDGTVVGLANHTVLVGKSGLEYSIDDCAAPIHDGASEIGGVVLVFRDVSGSRALENFRARLAAIVQSSDDAIVGKDMTGRITSWNPAATRLFGYTADEVIGRPISILIPPERLDEETRILERLRRGERVEHLETVRLAKDRRKIEVSLTISPIHDAEGHVVGASKIARDITEQKQTQRELVAARERLEKYSQDLERTVEQRTAELRAANQELEAFTYTAAHDLRAPLRSMHGLLAILEEDAGPGLSPDKRELLSRVTGSARRMSQLIDALLDLAKVGKHELRREPTSLEELVQSSLSDLSAECQGRQVEWKLGPLPVVECDPGLMQEALTNLLGNALKYTRPRSTARVEVGQMQVDGQTVVFVRDNGIGFNMEQAQKLFTPFHRLHPERQFEGSGIGLAAVDRIIRRHGGRVWAESKPEEGATFYFTLGVAGGMEAKASGPTGYQVK